MIDQKKAFYASQYVIMKAIGDLTELHRHIMDRRVDHAYISIDNVNESIKQLAKMLPFFDDIEPDSSFDEKTSTSEFYEDPHEKENDDIRLSQKDWMGRVVPSSSAEMPPSSSSSSSSSSGTSSASSFLKTDNGNTEAQLSNDHRYIDDHGCRYHLEKEEI